MPKYLRNRLLILVGLIMLAVFAVRPSFPVTPQNGMEAIDCYNRR